jgi:hypothetical protein
LNSDEEIQEIIPSLQRDSPVPPPPPPLAASTPNMVQGFENDYVDDDADLDELIACISRSQALEQAQLAQQVTKNPISRSLFKDEEQDDSAGGNYEPKQIPNDINIPSTSNDQQSTYKKQPTLSDPLEHQLKLPNVEPKKSLSLVKPSRQLSPPKLIPQIQLGPPKLQNVDTVIDQTKIARVPAVIQKPANQVDETSDKITAANKKVILTCFCSLPLLKTIFMLSAMVLSAVFTLVVEVFKGCYKKCKYQSSIQYIIMVAVKKNISQIVM